MQNIIVKQFVAAMQRKILETTNWTILTPPTFPMAHFESYGPNFKGTCQFWKYFIIFWSQPTPIYTQKKAFLMVNPPKKLNPTSRQNFVYILA